MGSIAMHLYISKKIKDEYNFSDNFMIGAVLPDIYKKLTMTREQSHYLIPFTEANNITLMLPDLDRFKRENVSNMTDDVTKGYFAHLVQDYVWFRFFSGKFVTLVGNDENGNELLTYGKENHSKTHQFSEYLSQIYSDYSYWDKVLLSADDCLKYSNDLKKYLNDTKFNSIIDNEIIIHNTSKSHIPFFITEETINRYVNASIASFNTELKKMQFQGIIL